MKFLATYRQWTTLKKTAFWLATAVVFYTLIGFLIVPPILKAVLEKKLPQVLARPVSIEKIRMNPYALSLTVEGFNLSQKEGTGSFVAFDRLYLNLEGQSLFRRALILSSLSLEGPSVEFTHRDDGSFSFSDLLSSPKAETAPPEKASEPFLFSINNIEIERGHILYHDLPHSETHRVDDLRLAIPTISNLPSHIETTVQPVFSATVNGTHLDLAGGSKPFADSRATEASIKMTGIALPEYLSYIPNPTGLVPRSALLDVDTTLTYFFNTDQSSKLSLAGTIRLRDLDVTDLEGKSYLRIPSVTVVLGDSNLLAGEVHLAEVSVDAPELEMIRQSSGDILPLSLLSAREKTADKAAPVEQEKSAAPFTLLIDKIRLANGAFAFTDRTLQKPASLSLNALSLNLDHFSTQPDSQAEIAFSTRINQTGQLDTQGTLVLTPLSLKTGLDLKALALRDFQSYLSAYTHITLKGGALNLSGNLDVRQKENHDLAITFNGETSIPNLATVDTTGGDDLVQWKNLQLKKIAFSLSPVRLDIGTIRLEDPSAQVLVRHDGSVNLASLAKEGEKSVPQETSSRSESPQPQISVGSVDILNGTVRFQDRSIEPSYGSTLDRLNGSISGLSSQTDKKATVKLDARVDKQAPLSISGEINPLSREKFILLHLAFKDFNMSSLSPYTGKYIGYKTEKGKLNLNLRYDIQGNQLDSSNRVFLDQFTLGESVDSPDATSLPVSLAIALLKDRSGEISLDIPVSGNLDDPEFSVGGVIIQVLVNLVAKAATSPFALLASLIPEGQDLQYLFFEPGSSELTKDTVGKLTTVAHVLQERPGLRMDLAGELDPQQDGPALARARMLKRISMEKLRNEGTQKGEENPEITASDEDYPKYLEEVYRKDLRQLKESDRDAVRAEKPETGPEAITYMEAFILKDIRIKDEDLRLLALDRANAILAQLVQAGKVEAERLYVVEPQPLKAESKEPTTQPWVELLIK